MDLENRTRVYINQALKRGSVFEREKVINDWLQKSNVSEGIVNDFKKRVGDPNGKKVLDVGFGNGVTLAKFVSHGASMSGLEVSSELFDFAKDVLDDSKVTADIRLYDGENFPFADDFFNFAYSVSVLEHVSNPMSVLKETSRVLKTGGKFYLAFPNKLYPKETHTGLWFISYLPRRLASRVASFFGRSSFDDYWNLHFISYFTIMQILKQNRIPLKVSFETEGNFGFKKLIKNFLAFFGIHHSTLLPHVMIVLEKYRK